MQRKANHLAENVENAVMLLKALLKFDVLVPERVSQEVLTTALCTTLKESNFTRLENMLNC